MRLQVLDLDTLIEVKAETGRAKDQLLVPVLLALRDEIRQGEGGLEPPAS